MFCVYKEIDNIYKNLATEEFLLKSKTDDVIFLWRSEPCVVVGKHQNTMAEVNFRYVRNRNIQVARRLSGGGAVYHDKGNLNFTFIKNGENGKLIDFKKFVGPVVEFLKFKGLKAQIGSKHDILIDNNRKISGNAEHIFKNRVLHHGTLLYNSNVEALNSSLKAIPGRYIDKAVQSNRSVVANISDFIKGDQTIEEFSDELFKYLSNEHGCSSPYTFSMEELSRIEKLTNEKYSTWNWVYGYSPAFEIRRIINIEGENNQIYMKIVKGFINAINIKNLTISKESGFYEEIKRCLFGCRYDYSEIEKSLHNSKLSGINIKAILGELF